jgi:polysaccharide export outer membrane protein
MAREATGRSEPRGRLRGRHPYAGLSLRVAMGSILIAGCTGTSHLLPAPLTPAPTELLYVTSAYRIQVGDVLSIRLLLSPELNEDVTVRPDGHISTTVVPDEAAADRTVPELIAVLAQSYERYLRQPHVSVIVKTIAPIPIYVGGEVIQPGEVLTAGVAPTLSQAIARAGGIKLSGDDTRVFIVRRGPKDIPVFLSARYDAVRLSRDPQADVRLAPFDIVMVPRLDVAEVYRWYNQYIQQFVNPNIGFSYLLNPTNGGQTVINP